MPAIAKGEAVGFDVEYERRPCAPCTTQQGPKQLLWVLCHAPLKWLFRGIPVAMSFTGQLRETRTAAFMDAIHHAGNGKKNVTALRRNMASIRFVLYELVSTVCCCLWRCVTAFYGMRKCIQLNRYGYRCANARKAIRNHLGQLRLRSAI